MSLANNPSARNRALGVDRPEERRVAREWLVEEPVEGSVVMTESTSGTAWQRFFSDGLWHSTTGKTKPWAEVGIRPAGLPQYRVLIYTAPKD